jgi:hypothetical protein
MKLESKPSAESQFVGQHQIPSVQAFSDTSVVMSAYLEALSSLLVLCESETESEAIIESRYQNYSTLRHVRQDLDDDLLKADVMLEAIEALLRIE